MTIHNRSTKPLAGLRKPLHLIVPLPPRASPRACLEAQIDLLLEMLDHLSGDPDLEDNGDLEPSIGTCIRGEVDVEGDSSDDEPSLGSFDRAINQTHWHGSDSQFQNGTDRELDRADNEPCLGAPIGQGDQRHWAQGKDAEPDEPDDDGDEHDEDRDGEPSLGAPERAEDANQIGWAQGGHSDLEQDGLAPGALNEYLRKAASRRAYRFGDEVRP